MEAAPWWAPSVVGLVGVVVGAVIGLVGTWIATTRQIAHAERESRASVYASFVSAAIEALDAADLFENEMENDHDLERGPLAGWRRDVLTGRKSPDEVIEEVDRTLEQREDHTDVLRGAYRRHFESLRKLHTRLLEVGLMGPPVTHEAALDVSLAFEKDEERVVASEKFHEALADFMMVARADLRAPSKPKSKTRAPALPKERRREAAAKRPNAKP